MNLHHKLRLDKPTPSMAVFRPPNARHVLRRSLQHHVRRFLGTADHRRLRGHAEMITGSAAAAATDRLYNTNAAECQKQVETNPHLKVAPPMTADSNDGPRDPLVKLTARLPRNSVCRP